MNLNPNVHVHVNALFLALAFTLAACGPNKPAPAPESPPPITSAPTPPPGPMAGTWYADTCERTGPASCEFKDPIEVPNPALSRCSAIAAEAGRPCKTEKEKCELAPQQRDRLSPCTLPPRHLTCSKKAPQRVCATTLERPL